MQEVNDRESRLNEWERERERKWSEKKRVKESKRGWEKKELIEKR